MGSPTSRAATPATDLIISFLVLFIAVTVAIFIHNHSIFPSSERLSSLSTTTTAAYHNDTIMLDYHIIKSTTSCSNSTISRPVVNHSAADQTIHQILTQLRQSFTATASAHQTCQAQQKITFSYAPISNRYFSITFHDSRIFPTQTLTNAHFYTFDLQSGNTIVLQDVLKDSLALETFGDAAFAQQLLSSNFAIDSPSRAVLLQHGGITENISFDLLSPSLAPATSYELFGIPILAPNPPDHIDCSVSSCLALTFDDGPTPYTDRLLDILHNAQAKATFFVLGNRVGNFPQQVQRAARAGHDIGSHSWSHRNLPALSYDQIVTDLRDSTHIIQSLTYQQVRFLRPPYGNVNSSVQQIAAELGQSIVLWSIDTNDWRFKDSNYICQHVVQQARPGSVILLHDLYPTSIDAAQCIIDRLSPYYLFVNLSTLYH